MKPTLRWLTLFTRVMVGLLFGMSGYYKVFILTAPVHARMFFTGPYANNWMPHWLLLVTGLVIPFVELACGWLLGVGLFRRPASIVLGFLLLLVTYGHELKQPVFDISAVACRVSVPEESETAVIRTPSFTRINQSPAEKAPV